MLDYRYRVVNTKKALPLMDRAVKPFLIDQATGAKVFVPNPPKVGSLQQRTRKPIADRTYCIMFANPGRFIEKASKVTVVIGNLKLENLVVE